MRSMAEACFSTMTRISMPSINTAASTVRASLPQYAMTTVCASSPALSVAPLSRQVFFFFNYEGARANNVTFENTLVGTPQFDALLLAARPNTPVATILQSAGLTPRISSVSPPDCTPFPSGTCVVVGSGMNIGSPVAAYGTYDPSNGGLGGGQDRNTPDVEFAEIFLPEHSGDQTTRGWTTAGKNQFSINTFLTRLQTFSATARRKAAPCRISHSRI